MSSMDNWFTSSGNNVSSAHFGVAKDGRIHQYVDIRLMAWANGLPLDKISNAPAQIVKDHPGVNPNKYTISIEHEGTDGNLTPEQLAASVWLHFYIQQQVKQIWGKEFELDSYHVIGHCHIDPIRKANCPGPKFPWTKLYDSLKGDEGDMKIAELEKIVKEQDKRIKELEAKACIPEPPEWALEACVAAKKVEALNTSNNGSYDFYRFVTMMHRAGLFKEK